MARNAAWRKNLNAWIDTVEQWVTHADPQDILSSDIFYDAKTVYGDWDLANRLREKSFTLASGSTNFIKFHTLKAADFRVPLGLFNRFKLDNGRLDLKMGGIMPIFSTARVLALEHGLTGYSTPERLDQAVTINPKSQSTIDSLIEAHKIILQMILSQQLRDIDAGIALSNSIAPSDLSAHEKGDLRWALSQVSLVSGLLEAPMV